MRLRYSPPIRRSSPRRTTAYWRRTGRKRLLAKEAELAEKSSRLKELNNLLSMDQKDKTLMDDAPEEESPEKEKSRSVER